MSIFEMHYYNIKRLFVLVIILSIFGIFKQFWYLKHQNKKIYNLHDAQMIKSKLLNVKYVSPKFSLNYENERKIIKRSIHGVL